MGDMVGLLILLAVFAGLCTSFLKRFLSDDGNSSGGFFEPGWRIRSSKNPKDI